MYIYKLMKYRVDILVIFINKKLYVYGFFFLGKVIFLYYLSFDISSIIDNKKYFYLNCLELICMLKEIKVF